jgi:hypothetical protein
MTQVNMSETSVKIKAYIIEGQHIREYADATRHDEKDVVQLKAKQ